MREQNKVKVEVKEKNRLQEHKSSMQSPFIDFCFYIASPIHSLVFIVMNSQRINEESSMNICWENRMETSEVSEEVSEEGQDDKSIRRGSYESRRWSEWGEHEVVFCKETRWMKWGEVDKGRRGGEERNELNIPFSSNVDEVFTIEHARKLLIVRCNHK